MPRNRALLPVTLALALASCGDGSQGAAHEPQGPPWALTGNGRRSVDYRDGTNGTVDLCEFRERDERSTGFLAGETDADRDAAYWQAVDWNTTERMPGDSWAQTSTEAEDACEGAG